jgi:hypothetical protein
MRGALSPAPSKVFDIWFILVQIVPEEKILKGIQKGLKAPMLSRF